MHVRCDCPIPWERDVKCNVRRRRDIRSRPHRQPARPLEGVPSQVFDIMQAFPAIVLQVASRFRIPDAGGLLMPAVQQ